MTFRPLCKATAKKRIAVLVETSNQHGRSLIEGITEFNRERQDWSLELLELARSASPPDWLREWSGDGIIARIETQSTARVIAATGVPIVNLSAGRLMPSAPLIETDDAAIADLAYNHLSERGFDSFGFCGDSRFAWSRSRANFFKSRVEGSRRFYSEFSPESGSTPAEQRAQIARWLHSVLLPIGILACYDVRARELVDVCIQEGLRVPEDVAVVGIDDEPLLCKLGFPSLTSISLNSRRMGYLAADLLERMMTGKDISRSAIFVEPVGLTARESTDILATPDPMVAKALHYIHLNSCNGIAIKDVLDHVGTSRRVLEGRFQRCLGRTPHKEIMNVKLRRVQELLKNSDKPLYQIADETGFRHPEYLSVSFRRQTGEWPSEYRHRHRMLWAR